MGVTVIETGSTRWRDLALLTLIGLIAFLPGLATLPPIDRDESRYMQATVQMVETGDLVDIRFQDDARHKKPAGSYWAQYGSLALTGQFDDVKRGERAVWAHRLPSVLGALIAVWATYLAGVVLFGRHEAFLGAGLFAVSVSLVFEAHIAKTDAMLAGASAVVLYGIVTRKAWPVWLGFAAGTLLKGPVLLGVAALALITEAIWTRSSDRIHGLMKPLPIFVALLITLPWFIAIGIRTDGAFFATSLGDDFGSKIGSAQETHGGPPGYYLLTTLGMLWPGVLALPMAALFAWRERVNPEVRLLLSWLVPMWLILEFVPTKLPHYTLPLYPALALLAGAAWVRLEGIKIRWVGLATALIVGVILSAGVALSLLDVARPWATISVGSVMVVATLIMLILFYRKKEHSALFVAAIVLGVGFGGLSRSPLLDLSPRLMAFIPDGSTVVSPDYREPSLVFLAGTRTKLTRDTQVGDILILSRGSHSYEELTYGNETPQCAVVLRNVGGLNYAKGQDLELTILKTDTCTQAQLDAWTSQTNL